MKINPIPYLLDSSQPWISYNIHTKYLDEPKNDKQSLKLKKANLKASLIQESIEMGLNWEDAILKRHNDANHPIHRLEILAELGLTKTDPGIAEICEKVFLHQTEEGTFQSNIMVPKSFKGSGIASWEWMACDFPILIYFLVKMGFQSDNRVKKSIDHLIGLIHDNGLRCCSSVPKFRGPGRKADHCPYANLLALKALADSSGTKRIKDTCSNAIQAQLDFWENRTKRKIYLFGIGTDFQKLKYPNVYYNIIHVLDVLSLYQEARESPLFQEMLAVVNDKQNKDGSFTAESVWRAFKNYDFGQKKASSPTLTYKIMEINNRCNMIPKQWLKQKLK